MHIYQSLSRASQMRVLICACNLLNILVILSCYSQRLLAECRLTLCIGFHLQQRILYWREGEQEFYLFRVWRVNINLWYRVRSLYVWVPNLKQKIRRYTTPKNSCRFKLIRSNDKRIYFGTPLTLFCHFWHIHSSLPYVCTLLVQTQLLFWPLHSCVA